MDMSETTTNDKNTVLITAVHKAFELMEETSASQKSFLNILYVGRDLYCKGDPELILKWPESWSACLSLMKQHGYKEPLTYYALQPARLYRVSLHQFEPSSQTMVW